MTQSKKRIWRLARTVCSAAVLAATTGCREEPPQPRSDAIALAKLERIGPLQKAPVIFLHDRHTQRVDDCQRCHPPWDGEVPTELRYALYDPNGAYDTTMDQYHNQCIGCHRTMREEEEPPYGPVLCGECHRKSPLYEPSHEPMGFDKYLHQLHVDSGDCDECHHNYDPKTESLIYIEGGERSCRECHSDRPGAFHSISLGEKENDITMRRAAHQQCSSCHEEMSCDQCHEATLRALFDPPEEVERLDRGQPDRVLIKGALEDLEKSMMGSVSFNHEVHEEYSRSCRECHHESLRACKECHTLTGSHWSNDITLERSMHFMGSRHSCVGCHDSHKSDTACAGCHSLMEEGRLSEGSCDKCHNGPAPETIVRMRLSIAGEAELTDSQFEALHDMFPEESYNPDFSLFRQDIPETVAIGVLSDEYQPVLFEHRKMIDSLVRRIGDSRLATHFHGQADALCQGCHHSSSIGERPPLCENCHGRPFRDNSPFEPGLKGAYHRQCIGCHQAMELDDAPIEECGGCHAPRSQPQPPAFRTPL